MNNLKNLRESLELKQGDFAELFGLPQTTYSGYETGQREPKVQFWIDVADRYHISTDYLLGQTDDRTGTKYGAKSDLDRKYEALDEQSKKLVDLVMEFEAERFAREVLTPIVDLGTIRHYLYSPAAGPDGMVSGADYEDIPRTPDMPKNADFCLTVSGDSMEPYLHDGQMIYIAEDAPLGELEVGVFFYHGGVYVKQYAPSYDGSVYLLSANPEREAANITVPRDSVPDLCYFGKVLGIKKRLPPPIYK